MLTSISIERQPRLLCAYKEGESIPSVNRTCAKNRAGASTPRWVRSFSFAYHLRMRNFLTTFSPAYASAMRRGFLQLRGFCASSPVAQAAAFRPAAVSPAPTFFAVRRFVRFIQPAPNPAVERDYLNQGETDAEN